MTSLAEIKNNAIECSSCVPNEQKITSNMVNRMKTICYVVPYFGKFPEKGFKLWLMSCKTNPTINWIIFTDDRTKYDYPDNVKVYYCSFDDIRKRFQDHFDFPIVLDRGWKLCDYRVAYGEIFAEELKGFDFWGNCDIDLIWGNIRQFLTDDILSSYDKIGFCGHSILYKNTPEVNSRYKTIVNGKLDYKTAFSESEGHAFDEVGIQNIYEDLNIESYDEVHFANLTKYETGFHLDFTPENEEYKNKKQIFTWDNGTITRYYLHKNEIYTEEYMYIHFWCRPMSYKITDFNKGKYLIYSDVVTDNDFKITKELIRKKGSGNAIAFYAKSIWINRKKITLKKIIFNIKGSLNKRKK